MKASIITIGDEILIGQIVDTNSAYMAQQLNIIGVKVEAIETVADSRDAILQALERNLKLSDLVLITGGIGPTKDDITKHTLASFFDMELVQHPEVARHVEALLATRGIPYNDLNIGQSLLPDGCRVLHNAHGTAPGMWFDYQGKVVVSMPGVPFEMKGLMVDHVLPMVKSHFSLKHVIHHTIITYGLPESVLAERIAPWEDALPTNLKLAYLPNPNFVRLRLSAYDVEDLEAVNSEIAHQESELHKLIGDNILGGSDATLEAVVSFLLREGGHTLSTAESCTGGAIAARFTALAGASDIFMGGVVSYSNQVKMDVLGVSSQSLESHGAVSEEVAIEMAQGVRRVMKTTYSIATTGIAGPSGGSEDKPVGTVWIAVDTPRGTFTLKRVYDNLRAENIARFSSNAINLLRENIV